MVIMELIPPSLEDMGCTLWGPGWRDCLAYALDVEVDNILVWETEPEKRPADLQDQIENLGMTRIGEIELMLTQMKEAGLAMAVAHPDSRQ